jgi:hypothetical protein
MKTVDRVFGWLLVAGALGHTMGSIRVYGRNPEVLLWALSASLFALLLAAVNLLRTSRPQDHALAWVSFVGCIAQFSSAFTFGRLIGNVFDFRPFGQMIIALVLALFSLRMAMRKAGQAA